MMTPAFIQEAVETAAAEILEQSSYIRRYAFHGYLKHFCKYAEVAFPKTLPKRLKKFKTDAWDASIQS